jgi:hypothetical protein
MKKLAVVAVLVGIGLLVRGELRVTDEPVIIPVQMCPHMLAIGGPGVWLTVHADIAYSAVDLKEEIEFSGVRARICFPDRRGLLVAKFPQGVIEAIVAPPAASRTLTGVTKASGSFEGTDTIQVKQAK